MAKAKVPTDRRRSVVYDVVNPRGATTLGQTVRRDAKRSAKRKAHWTPEYVAFVERHTS